MREGRVEAREVWAPQLRVKRKTSTRPLSFLKSDPEKHNEEGLVRRVRKETRASADSPSNQEVALLLRVFPSRHEAVKISCIISLAAWAHQEEGAATVSSRASSSTNPKSHTATQRERKHRQHSSLSPRIRRKRIDSPHTSNIQSQTALLRDGQHD